MKGRSQAAGPEVDSALVLADQFLSDRQPHTGPPLLGRNVGLEKVLLNLNRNAGARVGDVDQELTISG